MAEDRGPIIVNGMTVRNRTLYITTDNLPAFDSKEHGEKAINIEKVLQDNRKRKARQLYKSETVKQISKPNLHPQKILSGFILLRNGARLHVSVGSWQTIQELGVSATPTLFSRPGSA
ncbi:hypothetical protein TNIN_385481 [Trichonephila inaurata madagascariensis]|uniref:Uncharacterized protein n=1 Tax=Trichonephila inaurata madagascariensis TaxID=2747483 RepID=A0A8X7C4G3_9ARAC|nr:hypothetical protein TNIN_385481 [Trichonephila inaurata madagascariensis]